MQDETNIFAPMSVPEQGIAPAAARSRSILIVGRRSSRADAADAYGMATSWNAAVSWSSSFRRAAHFQFDRDMLQRPAQAGRSERSGSISATPSAHPEQSAQLRTSYALCDEPDNDLDEDAADLHPFHPHHADLSLLQTSIAASAGSRQDHEIATPAETDQIEGASRLVEEDCKSSYAQSLFNAVNILMGIGILALPFAFRLTGWLAGICLLFVFGSATRHTARILSKCLDWQPNPLLLQADLHNRSPTNTFTHLDQEQQPLMASADVQSKPTLCTYGDIGEVALGPAGRSFITFIFVVELLTVCIALVILTADSVVALLPHMNGTLIKIAMVVVVFPLTLPRSLNIASYGSLIGIVALANLVVIVVTEGFLTTESPGSLVVPAETNLFPQNWLTVPLAFGLIMAGFSGHSVFPNIYRDMRTPNQYYRLVDESFVITGILYLAIASAGYVMFGTNTMHEITQNLPRVASYNKILTQITVWLVAISPITKYPLCISPVNAQVERWMADLMPSLKQNSYTRFAARFVVSASASSLILLVAVVFPGFHNMMGILGSFFSFTVSVIFPEICYLQMFGHRLSPAQKAFEWFMFAFGCVFAVVGTIWACLPDSTWNLNG